MVQESDARNYSVFKNGKSSGTRYVLSVSKSDPSDEYGRKIP